MMSQSDEVNTSINASAVNISSANASMLTTSTSFSHVPNQHITTPPKPGLASGFVLPSSASSAKAASQAGGATWQRENVANVANVGTAVQAPVAAQVPAYAAGGHRKVAAANNGAGGMTGATGAGVKRPAVSAPSNPYAKKR